MIQFYFIVFAIILITYPGQLFLNSNFIVFLAVLLDFLLVRFYFEISFWQVKAYKEIL